MTTTTLRGWDAIEYAEAHEVTLCKTSDPTEDARTGLTVAQAREVAAEDPGLIYVEVAGEATTAERIAERLGGDGTTFEVPARPGEPVEAGARVEGHTSLDALSRAAGARVEREPGRGTRYLYPDGSLIVDSGPAWDVGLSPACWCWSGAGHSGNCPEAATHEVVRYAADGCAGGESDGQVIARGLTLAEAKRLADRGHGSWSPDGDGEVIAYHESDRTGCGGYVVRVHE